MLGDLKALDKLAKAKDAGGVPGTSAALRGRVLDFLRLEPTRLAERFGVSDIEGDGSVSDL